MFRVSDNVKLEMLGRGVWRDYVVRAEDLKLGGMGTMEANRAAMAEVAPDLAERAWARADAAEVAAEKSAGKLAESLEKQAAESSEAAVAESEGGGVAAKRRRKAAGGAVKAPRRSVGATTRADVRSDSEPVSAPPAKDAPTAADFVGRKASATEEIRWVIENLAFAKEDVDLKSAPSAFALSFYYECLKSPSFKSEFMLKTLQGILRKAEDDAAAGGIPKWDGQTEYDLAATLAGGGA